MKKIDCHTHIINEELKKEYYSQTDGYALVMQFIPRLLANPDCLPTVMQDDRLFLCAGIDIALPLAPQFDQLTPLLPTGKLVGLKMYLTYQRGRACDEKLFPIYDFAQRNRLSVAMHTGVGALVLPSDNDLEGSSAIYIAKAAEQFPKVNFILSHMDDPRMDTCVKLVKEHDNMFTDMSGAYEENCAEVDDVKGAAENFCRTIHTQPDMDKKILYGTDFCPIINLNQIDAYDYTLRQVFEPHQFEDVYFNNCLRAYPRLADTLKA